MSLLPGRASRRRRCDFWQVDAARTRTPDNLWYRFIVTDGTDTDYYADDTAALDGGLGAPTDDPVDNSWALMVYEPGFTAPAWAKNAVIYQIFPDRFRNGTQQQRPKTGDARYDDPVLEAAAGDVKPEGYCRNYADGDRRNCPWRFDTTPPADSPTKEQPARPRLLRRRPKGVDQKLDYLQAARRQHDLLQPDLRRRLEPRLRHPGLPRRSTRTSARRRTGRTWSSTPTSAGIRIILDGVFNHMSSDSPFFDRYHHYADGRRLRVGRPRRTALVHVPRRRSGHGTCAGSPGSELGDLRRLVRLRLDPGADTSREPAVQAVLPHRRRTASRSTG